MNSTKILAAVGVCAVAFLPAAVPTPTQAAERRPVTVALTQVATAEAPTAGAQGPNGTLWIGQRAGAVRVLTDQGLSAPVLTVQTTTDGERGLAGITFDPDFSHFYVSYTNLQGHNTVEEFDVVDGQVQVSTGRVVFFAEQPGPAHNSGHIAFGPDGMFYISIGDGDYSPEGDPYQNGQNLGTLLGKVLRIDLDAGDPYGIPADNPFVDDPAAKGEIWAYGLRNPWQFSFDAETGDLWIGDVGHLRREEVNRAPAGVGGQNFGWSNMEGTLVHQGTEPSDHVPPVYEWEHGTGGGFCDSVTGGFVYRGNAIPDLRGHFVFANYCSGELQALDVRTGQVAGVVSLGANAGWVSTFVQTLDNELYVFDMGPFFGSPGNQTPIYRIGPA
jgi:glucose/arabinose dehydrogenase